MGGLTIRSCYESPAALEATQAAYEEQIEVLEYKREEAEAEAEARRASALRYAEEADRLRIERDAQAEKSAAAREEIAELRRIAAETAFDELPQADREDPETLRDSVRMWEFGFQRMDLYAKSLEEELRLERERSAQLQAALADMTKAYCALDDALKSCVEQSAVAGKRAEAWRGTSRKKKWLTAGGVALAVVAALVLTR